MWLATVAFDCRELAQTRSFRGSKSRNKVSVGEPAEGSLLKKFSVSETLFAMSKSGFGFVSEPLTPLLVCKWLVTPCPALSEVHPPCARRWAK